MMEIFYVIVIFAFGVRSVVTGAATTELPFGAEINLADMLFPTQAPVVATNEDSTHPIVIQESAFKQTPEPAIPNPLPVVGNTPAEATEDPITTAVTTTYRPSTVIPPVAEPPFTVTLSSTTTVRPTLPIESMLNRTPFIEPNFVTETPTEAPSTKPMIIIGDNNVPPPETASAVQFTPKEGEYMEITTTTVKPSTLTPKSIEAYENSLEKAPMEPKTNCTHISKLPAHHSKVVCRIVKKQGKPFIDWLIPVIVYEPSTCFYCCHHVKGELHRECTEISSIFCESIKKMK